MWGMSSAAPDRRPEILWGLFAIVCAFAMYAYPNWETIPFHFIWVSLTLLYGRRVWASAPTVIVLGAVMLVTGVLIVYDTLNTDDQYFLLELTEVPLMSAMFVAMVGYARRREAALAEVRRLADIDEQMLARERAFVRDAVHELRAPITVARGHAELMRLGPGVSNERDVVVVLDELSSLSSISERMLAVAASDGSEQLRLRVFDTSALVNGAGLRWMPTVSRRWTINAPRTAAVLGDRSRLQAALDALIENALAFTGVDDRRDLDRRDLDRRDLDRRDLDRGNRDGRHGD